MVRKPVLGRGLDALLSASNTSNLTEPPNRSVLKKIPIEQIHPSPYQPRLRMDEASLKELAESIRGQGLVQPIVVRRAKPDGFELIAGERRWRAAQLIGLHEIPAVIRDIPDQAAAAMALIENIQREDLNALEEAQALRRLIDEFGLTHQQLADLLGRSRATITNLLRLLELGEVTKQALTDGELEMGHARALLALRDAPAQAKAARKVIQQQLSVRNTEKLVKSLLQEHSAKISKPASPDIQQLEHSLAETLGAKVALQHNTKGKGKLVIQYNSLDELDGILAHIH